MTVSSTKSRSGPYIGDGKIANFPYDFLVYDTKHLEVVQADLSGQERILVKDLDYTIDNTPPNGGVVFLKTAPARGDRIAIRRNVPALQETVLRNQAALFPADVERMADLGAMYAQQRDEAIERSIKLPVSSPGRTTVPASPEQRANKALVFNDSGDIAVSLLPFEKYIADVRGHTDSARVAQRAARESVNTIRQMLSPGGPWPSFGSWLGVPEVLDFGQWSEQAQRAGICIDLGGRWTDAEVISCGQWLGSGPLVINMGDPPDDGYRRYEVDCGERF